jgi:hypothetical protein
MATRQRSVDLETTRKAPSASPAEEIAAVRERLRTLEKGQVKNAVDAIEALCTTAEERAQA